MKERPWVSGPKELLLHAIEHLHDRTSASHRLAFISVDNAVELTIATYLGLPERARKTPGPLRRELDDARGKMPALLGLLEHYAADKLEGIEIADVHYFHRLRNVLYHEGNGIAVEADKLEAYIEIARILFLNLFDVDVRGEVVPEPESDTARLLAKYADLFGILNQRQATALSGHAVAEDAPRYGESVHGLAPSSPPKPDVDFRLLRTLRNRIAQGEATPELISEALVEVERAEEQISTNAGTVRTCDPRQPLPPGCAPYLQNRESKSRKHADPPLVDATVEVAPGHFWRPVAYAELLRRFTNSGYRGNVLAFVPGGHEAQIRERGVRLNRGEGSFGWGVRYMYSALGCWGYPVTQIGGSYRLWSVDGAGRLVDDVTG